MRKGSTVATMLWQMGMLILKLSIIHNQYLLILRCFPRFKPAVEDAQSRIRVISSWSKVSVEIRRACFPSIPPSTWKHVGRQLKARTTVNSEVVNINLWRLLVTDCRRWTSDGWHWLCPSTYTLKLQPCGRHNSTLCESTPETCQVFSALVFRFQ